MPNNNSVNTPLRGTTGTGSHVGSNSPSIVTPDLGTPSSLILTNATGDKLGVLDGTDAAVGHVGQYFFQNLLIGSATSLTSGIAANVFPLTTSLPIGDWDCYGTIIFNPDVTTTSTSLIAALNISSATLPTFGTENNISFLNISFSAGQSAVLKVGPFRSSSQFTQAVFLIAQATFSVSTMSVYGYMSARRVR